MCAAIFTDPGNRLRTYVYCCNDGRSYYLNKHKETVEGVQILHLRCALYCKLQCKGSAAIFKFGDAEQWHNGQAHSGNCPLDHGRHEQRLLRFDILSACRQQPHARPRFLIDQISSRYPIQIAARVRLPRMRHAIRRARMSQNPNIPVSLRGLGDVLGSDQYRHLTATYDGQDSIYCATVGGRGKTSIIFVSQRMLRFLPQVHTVFCDGTFASTPALPAAQQVYQIVTVLRDSVIPLVQVIMEKRTLSAYLSVLNHIKQICPAFQPHDVMMDFEGGHYRAWTIAYPNSNVSGCFVHSVRAIIRKSGRLGLKRNGLNPLIKRIIQLMIVLPLLPQYMIKAAFGMLVEIAQRRGIFDDMLELFHYYMRSWLQGWRFEVLSVFDLVFRSNNACESAHRILRIETGPHHPNIYTFIDGLRQYEQHAFTDTVAFRMGWRFGEIRRTMSYQNDEAIANFTRDLIQGTISTLTFLRRTSHRIATLVAYEW